MTRKPYGPSYCQPAYTSTNTLTSQVITSATYCYDHADRLLSTSNGQVGTPTYDDHGNTVTLAGNGTPTTLTYDALDSNTAIEQGANKVEYLKTGSGSVLRKKEYTNGVLTKSYRYIAGGAIMQSCSLTDQNNCTSTDTYLSLPGGVTLTQSPAHPDTAKRTVYSIKNFHGDTAMTASATGVPSSSVYLYEPYGQANASQTFGTNSDPGNATNAPMGWAASPTRKAETQFSQPIIQMGARVYLPGIGRFTQADPISGGNVNGYAYAVDPINTNDYSGMFLQGGSGSFLQGGAGATIHNAATPQRYHNAAPIHRVQPSAGYHTYNAPSRANITISRSNVPPPPPRPSPPVMPTIAPLNFLTGAAKDWQGKNFVAGDGTFKTHFSVSIGFTNADYITKGVGIKFSPNGIKFTTQVEPSWPMGLDASFTMSDKPLPKPGCTMEGSAFTPWLVGGSASSGEAIDPGIGSFGGSYVHSCMH